MQGRGLCRTISVTGCRTAVSHPRTPESVMLVRPPTWPRPSENILSWQLIPLFLSLFSISRFPNPFLTIRVLSARRVRSKLVSRRVREIRSSIYMVWSIIATLNKLLCRFFIRLSRHICPVQRSSREMPIFIIISGCQRFVSTQGNLHMRSAFFMFVMCRLPFMVVVQTNIAPPPSRL